MEKSQFRHQTEVEHSAEVSREAPSGYRLNSDPISIQSSFYSSIHSLRRRDCILDAAGFAYLEDIIKQVYMMNIIKKYA
jgi:hypothetical protein